MDNDILPKVKDFILTFTSIFYEALPFVVLGAAIAGILQEFLPQRLVTRVLPRSRFLAVALGGLLGLLFPMCECGIIPVMRRLLRKGLPLSCCLSYLLAGPIINFVVILSTFVAFSGGRAVESGDPRLANQMTGPWMVAFRVGFGYLVAIGTALIVEWQYRIHGDALLMPLARADAHAEEPLEDVSRKSWLRRLGNVSEVALHDFVDIAVFLILGAAVAALARQFITNERIGVLSSNRPVLSILIMMAFAVVVTLCSEADAFVAASFQTLRPAAKVAFLVLGPMLDFKLFFMYTRVFRPRLIWTIISAVVSQVFIYSILTHYFWERFGPVLLRWKFTP